MLAIFRIIILCSVVVALLGFRPKSRKTKKFLPNLAHLQKTWPGIKKYVQPLPALPNCGYSIAHRSRETLEAAGLLSPLPNFTPIIPPSQNVSASNVTVNVTVESAKEKTEAEDPIPLFDEWTKKKLEERQNASGDKQTDDKVGSDNSNAPVVNQQVLSPTITQTATPTQRNYASKDCGAKVLLTNPTAQNGNAVVKEKERDEYLLYTCDTEGKFFVLELCELMKPVTIQLANFELFSSSPKDFRVFTSTRYPTTEWLFLGEWTADDNRQIQSFPVKQASYVKFLKVELVSHHGQEHYCPLSLMRVLGVSMVDELDDEDTNTHPPPVVLNTNEVVLDTPASEPSNATANVTVDQNADNAENLDKNGADPDKSGTLLTQARDKVVHAAKKLASVVLGGNLKSNDRNMSTNASNCVHRPPMTSSLWLEEKCGTSFVTPPRQSDRFCYYFAAQRCSVVDSTHTVPNHVHWPVHVPRHSTKIEHNDDKDVKLEENVTKGKKYRKPKVPKKKISAPPGCSWLNVFVGLMSERPVCSKLVATPMPVTPTPLPIPDTDAHPPLPGTTATNKETVLVRLNNRIRTLEQNISLSSQYLSELSRRYRTQMEEMQRQYNRTLKLIEETSEKLEKKLENVETSLQRRGEEISKLKEQLTLSETHRDFFEQEFWKYVTRLLTVQMVFFCILIWYCSGVSDRRLNLAVKRALAEERKKDVQIYVNGVNGSVQTGMTHMNGAACRDVQHANGHCIKEQPEAVEREETLEFQPCSPGRRKTNSEGCDLLTPNPTPSVSTTDLSSEPETGSLPDYEQIPENVGQNSHDTPVKHEPRSPPFQFVKQKKRNKKKNQPQNGHVQVVSNANLPARNCSNDDTNDIVSKSRFGALSQF